MKIYFPDYYKDFECIKDKCKHSCCIGWEIDIDNASLSYYESVGGDFGKKLRDNISPKDTPHFILDKDERCPFLNSSNLCDIYIHCGREHLCEICSNHPRFVNVFSDREEWGLGMCCEAAAHIILNHKSPVRMICEIPDDTETEDIIKIRQSIINMLQMRNKSIKERLGILSEEYYIDFSEHKFEYWKEVFLNLEILDNEWESILSKDATPDYSWMYKEEYQLMLEQLAVYFVLRYINKENQDNIKGWLSLGGLGVYMISELFSREDNKSGKVFEDLCRMYSSEIEYSLDNMEELLFELA